MTFENMYAQCLRLLHHLCITHPHLAVAAAVAEDVMQRCKELVQPRDDDDRQDSQVFFFSGSYSWLCFFPSVFGFVFGFAAAW